MQRGPDIPYSGGGECDAFSRRYRRLRKKFVKAGKYTYWKTRYQRRSRRLAKVGARKVASNMWAHHLHPSEG